MEIKGKWVLYSIIAIILMVLAGIYLPWTDIFEFCNWLYGFKEDYWGRLLVRVIIMFIGLLITITLDAKLGHQDYPFICFIWVGIILPELFFGFIIIAGLIVIFSKVLIPWFDKHLTFKI